MLREISILLIEDIKGAECFNFCSKCASYLTGCEGAYRCIGRQVGLIFEGH